MAPPDFAKLHKDLKNGNPTIILSDLIQSMRSEMPKNEIQQYFYDLLDYIIKFGAKSLQDPIRELIQKI